MSVEGCHRFDGRRVLVTGAAQGIGRAIAERFAAEGARVVVSDVDAAAAAATADALVSEGRDAVAQELDVRSGDSISAAFAAVGDLDVVVANAGVQNFMPLAELGQRDWDRTAEINARGVFLTLQAAARVLREGGSAVVVASIQGYLPNTTSTDYAASKAAALSIMKSFAKELGPRGLRVNAVAPGRIETELTARGTRLLSELTDRDPAEVAAHRLAATPLGRAGQPHEVAAAVAFLASSDASYITGTTLDLCGGDVMR